MGPHVGLAGGCVYGAVTVSSSLQDLPHDIQMIDLINAAMFGAMAVDNMAQDRRDFVEGTCFLNRYPGMAMLLGSTLTPFQL